LWKNQAWTAPKPISPITSSLSVEAGSRSAHPDILEWPMKRYYFDLFDGSDVSRDEEGTNLHDLTQAKNAAAVSLLEIMRSRKLNADASELGFLVRDASDMAVFVVRLSLQVTGKDALFGSRSLKPAVTSLSP
jgi:hypothetical protein